MLSISPVSPGGGSPEEIEKALKYYIDYAAASGIEGRWTGRGAAVLGLAEGTGVDAEVLKNLCLGIAPSGEVLNKPQSGSTPAFDFCFSPPKSVSVMAYLHPDEAVRRETIAAHEAAVAAVVAHIEAEVMASRRGKGGRDGTVKVEIAAAQFRHGTSRENDPQVHTHVVAVAICLGGDGRWLTLDMTKCFGVGRAGRVPTHLGEVYDAAVRRELSSRLGVDWRRRGDTKAWEIAGVPNALIDEFSGRRQKIKAAIDRLESDSHAARQAATLSTRPSKDPEKIPEVCIDDWRARLASMKFGDAQWKRVGAKLGTNRPTAKPDLAQVLAGLVEKSPTFTAVTAAGAIADAARTGLTARQVEGGLAALLASGEAVEVTPPKRESGWQPERRWTTRTLLKLEADTLALARGASHRRDGTIESEIIERLIAADTLGADQADAVRHVLGNDGMVQIVESAAASGKTRTMRACHAGWKARRIPVLGLAMGASAAHELEEGSDIASQTIASWIVQGCPLPRGAVLVVDEAAQVSSSDLAKIVAAVGKAHGRLVLVGDRRQLPSVEVGGMFARLADKLGFAKLTENRRQVEEWEVKALSDLREGRVERGFNSLAAHDRVVVAEDELALASSLIGDWWAVYKTGADCRILSYSRRGTAALNAMARDHILKAGLLGDVVAEVESTDDLVEREFRVGDKVLLLDNATLKAQGGGSARVRNGQRGVVLGRAGKRLLVEVEPSRKNAHSRVIEIPPDYLKTHLDHAYASTVHKSQGSTVGKAAAARDASEVVRASERGECFVFGAGEMGGEAAYVAASRATDRTRLYVATRESKAGSRAEIDEAIARLKKSWTASEAEDAATQSAATQRRIAALADTMTRAQLEDRYKVADKAAAAAGIDPTEQLVEAWNKAQEAACGEDRSEMRKTALRLVEAQALAKAWEEAPPDARAAAGERDVLDAALKTLRARVVDQAEIVRPAWLTDAIGEPTDVPSDRVLWREAVGALLDAEHRITRARASSGSEHVRNLADPDIVRAEVSRAARASDQRRLEEVAEPHAGSVAAAVADLGGRLPEDATQIEKAPAVARGLTAIACLGGDLGAASRRATEHMGGVSSPVGLIATRLRGEAASLIEQADRSGQEVPAAVRMAVSPGFGFPDISAVGEASVAATELATRRAKAAAKAQAATEDDKAQRLGGTQMIDGSAQKTTTDKEHGYGYTR